MSRLEITLIALALLAVALTSGFARLKKALRGFDGGES